MKRRTFLSTTTKAALGASVLTSAMAQSVKKSSWHIGIFTRPWAAFEHQIAFDEMVKAGFQYAGIMTGPGGLIIDVETSEHKAQQVGEQAALSGLEILSVYGGQFYEDKSKEEAINGLKKLIDNTDACGSASLLLGGTGNEEAFDTYYDAVAACCDYAAERNIALVLKPHGGLNTTGPQCRKIIERVNHPNFQLWYDPGNIYYYTDGQLDPTKDVDTVGDIVKGMCVKDYKHPKQVALTPGTGMVDFSTLFKNLKAKGLSGGPLVIECLDEGDLATIPQQAQKAKAYLEKILS